jgi:hypothetical protein
MPALGSRKPSQLMAAMLEVCPRGAEKCIVFPCLFLRRLPRELPVLLARADHNDLKALAEQVDKQWALHAEEEPVAAVQQLHLEEEAVATVRNSGLPMQAPKRATGRRRRPRSRERRSQCSPKRLGRRLTFACLTGDTVQSSARFCNNPWAWQGNLTAGGM